MTSKSDPEKFESLFMDLESLVSPYTFKSWISNDFYRENYLRTAGLYFGSSRFPESAFDTLHKQLRQKVLDHKLLGERLWRKNPSRDDICFEANLVSYGRCINLPLWKLFMERWMLNLAQKGNEWLSIAPNKRLPIAREIIEEWKEILERRLKEINYCSSKRKSKIVVSTIYKTLAPANKLEGLTSYLMYETLENHRYQNTLLSGDADVVLHEMKLLRENPLDFSSVNLGLNLSFLVSFAKRLVPDIRELTNDHKLFPEVKVKTFGGKIKEIGRTRIGEYRLRYVRRPFHGVWRGIPFRECVGGPWNNPENLTPQRWALPAIKNSHLYFLERNGKFQGFIHLIPTMMGTKRFYSIELQSPELTKKILEESRRDGPIKPAFLVEKMLSALYAKHHGETSGFVVGFGDGLNDTGVRESLFQTNCYRFGEILGSSQLCSCQDEVTKTFKLLEYNPSLETRYGEGPIFECRLPHIDKILKLALPSNEIT